MSREYWNVEINRGAGYIKTHAFWADGWRSHCAGHLIEFYVEPGDTYQMVCCFASERINYMAPTTPPVEKNTEPSGHQHHSAS